MEGARLQRTLGYRPGQRIAWIGSPEDYPRLLGDLPVGIQHAHDALDCIHMFLQDPATAHEEVRQWTSRLAPSGMMWLSWPAGSGELDDATVRDIGRAAGLTDVKRCAVPGWAAMKFIAPRSPERHPDTRPQPF